MPRMEAQNHSPTVQGPFAKTAPAVHPTLDLRLASTRAPKYAKNGIAKQESVCPPERGAGADARAYFAIAARDERQAPNACQNAGLGDSGANSQFMWA